MHSCTHPVFGGAHLGVLQNEVLTFGVITLGDDDEEVGGDVAT